MNTLESADDIHGLFKRDGSSRNYNVDLGTESDEDGNLIILLPMSYTYSSGRNGEPELASDIVSQTLETLETVETVETRNLQR